MHECPKILIGGTKQIKHDINIIYEFQSCSLLHALQFTNCSLKIHFLKAFCMPPQVRKRLSAYRVSRPTHQNVYHQKKSSVSLN